MVPMVPEVNLELAKERQHVNLVNQMVYYTLPEAMVELTNQQLRQQIQAMAAMEVGQTMHQEMVRPA